MPNLKSALDHLATWRSFWTLFALEVLLLGCVNGLVFPLSVPCMVRLTGHKYLDMCAFCSAPRIYGQLASFGELGRHYQLLLLVTIDLAIPVTSLLFGIVGLKVLLRPHRSNVLFAFPVVAFVLDLLENAAIVRVTLAYPAHADAIAAGLGIVSGLKFCAYGLTLAAMVVAAARRIGRGPVSSVGT